MIQMALFQTIECAVEISGETILAFINAMGPFKSNAVRLLSKHGVSNIVPEEWYPQQACLDSFKNIPAKVGDTMVTMVGRNLGQAARLPPEIGKIEEFLSAIDGIYHSHYRNGEIGHYTFTKTKDSEGTLHCETPYPCPLIIGMLKAVCERLTPPGAAFSIEHSEASGCMQKNNVACLYLLKWHQRETSFLPDREEDIISRID
jgi:hypothetical protein